MKKFIFDKGKKRAVALSRIREFSFYTTDAGNVEIRGWYDRNDYFDFGEWPTYEEAEEWFVEHVLKPNEG